MFQYIAEATGFPIDQVRYLSLFALSYPLAVFYLVALKSGGGTGNTIRHAYSTALGVLFCYLCFSMGQLIALLAFVAAGYVLLLVCPGENVQLISFYYSMVCICLAHVYRLYTDYGGFHLDFTGPFMLMVQRVSYVGFAYHDGIGRESKDLRNEDQRINRITKLPSVLEYFSYNMCFLTVLAGPTCTYNEYIDMVTGKNFEHPGDKTSTSPSPFFPATKKLIMALSCLGLYLYLKGACDCVDEVLAESTPSLLRFLVYIPVFCFYIRCRYYFVYCISESISNTAGLGFYYDNDQGNNPKWDLAKTVDIRMFEIGLNCKEQSIAWNVCTQKWLRRTVYERPIPYISPVLWTFLVSAWWHGFYPSYYMSFMFLGSVTIAARKVRHLLWHRCQSPHSVKVLYDISTILATNFCKDFAEMTFVNHTSVYITLRIWKIYYCLPPIIVALIIFALPDKKKKRENQNGLSSETKKLE